MCLSVQTVLVIVIVAFSKVGSQPSHCDDVTKLAICNRPMSLLESGCKLATKVLQNSAIFRRFFGVSLEPQNTATINPTIGQFTINADTSPLLLASSEINQATVTIVVLSILLGVCVIIITVWGIYECVRRKRGKERKRRAEEALALYEKRRRQLKLDGDQLKAKKEDAPTVKGDLEEWSDCEENTSPGSDAHQESNGRRNKPDGNKSVPKIFIPWQFTRFGLGLRVFRFRPHLFVRRLFRTSLGERSLCDRLHSCRRRHVRVTGRYIYVHVSGERWLRIPFR